MSGERIGKFQILGTLGNGAHSTILKVRRESDSRIYALKVVPIEDKDDHKFLEQARHEFRVGQMLDHPQLIKIHTLETQSDWLFRVRKVQLLIEYVEGKTLDALPPMSMPRLVQVFARVAAGLSHMHRRGVFHADLKPNNIMLGKGGKVKIIDFGLAWIKDEPKDRIQGTPEYMAPETVRKSVINERTDLYNLGATMYRLVTWKFPPNPVALSNSIKQDEKAWKKLYHPPQELNPRAPKPLCSLIEHCLEYHPSKRPERASEVQDALDQLADELIHATGELLDEMD